VRDRVKAPYTVPTATTELYDTALTDHCLYTPTSPFWGGGGRKVGVYFVNQQMVVELL
jgi:hypothetical protein